VSKKYPLIFTTTDFFGNQVILKENTWLDHILSEHQDMVGHEATLEAVLKDPLEILPSTLSNTCAAYISGPAVGPRPEGVRVLVNYTDIYYEKGASSGTITTAYPIDIIKYSNPQLGKAIYKKGGRK
jgi:hypothetical protein